MLKKEITVESVIQRNTNILASDLDGEKVMMSIQKGEYYGLGKTGSFIWDQLENALTVSDLVSLITTKYEVTKEQCLADIMPFLNDLLEKKLILKIE